MRMLAANCYVALLLTLAVRQQYAYFIIDPLLAPKLPAASSSSLTSSFSRGQQLLVPTTTTTTTSAGTMMMATTPRRDVIRMPTTTPMVPYKPPGSSYAQFIDIEAAMYRDRTMFISRYIDDQAANGIISIMLYLRNESRKARISMYFNVPGASLRPALAIYDLMNLMRQDCEIETVNLAVCAGMGSILCGAGTKGLRHAMPNARFLLHRTGIDQVFEGQATDIALEVKNTKLWNDRMEEELAMLTGQPLKQIQKDLHRDFYLSSDEAVQYGLIDSVLLPSARKRAARGGVADLGTFEGEEEQRYQNQENQKSGWGRQRRVSPGGGDNRRDDDDDEPKIMKG